MKKILFEGSGVALITPFTKNGINYETLADLLEFQIENDTDAIIICGTTGEPSTMTENERKEVIKFTVEFVAGRIPVIAGVGSNNTSSVIEMAKYSQAVGADGLLIVSPYYNKTTQRGIISHYKAIADSTKLPIIIYNVPSRTGLNISPETVYELSKLENITAIKEASGNFTQIAEIIDKCGDNLYVYSGNDDQVVPMMALGAKGVISVSANIIPGDVHKMVKYFLEGDLEKSRKLQLKALNLLKVLFSEVNPIPVKEAVRQIGFDAGNCRLPLVDMSEEGQHMISYALEEYYKK